MDIKKVCICGGGSLGLVCAAVFLSKGLTVNILTGHPDKWSKNIRATDDSGRIFEGSLNCITDDPAMVIGDSDLVFLTVPGFLIESTLTKIKPYLKKETIVGCVVSSTGFFFAAHKILNPAQCIFGFQRVPFIARQREYGNFGQLLGYKSMLHVCVENCSQPDFLSMIQWLFNTPATLLDNFYEATLTNSNPILHTGRLYSMWSNYNGETCDSPSLFYSDWTDESSELLIKMDEEFQSLLRALGIREGAIPPLLEYYESSDAASFTAKLRSIPAFKTITSPMVETPAGWIPDFNSRYSSEDFPFGLRFIRDLAKQHNVATPYIDMVYSWGIMALAKS